MVPSPSPTSDLSVIGSQTPQVAHMDSALRVFLIVLPSFLDNPPLRSQSLQFLSQSTLTAAAQHPLHPKDCESLLSFCDHHSHPDPDPDPVKMTTSKRIADIKSTKFQKNVHRRGNVPETAVKKKSQYPVGPMVLALFVFVVIGSSVIQIFRSATSGGMA